MMTLQKGANMKNKNIINLFNFESAVWYSSTNKYPASNVPEDYVANWVCPEGHKYRAPVKDQMHFCVCPYCSGQKVLAGYNDLESRRPIIAQELDEEKSGVTARRLLFDSPDTVWWKCSKGHSYSASPVDRLLGIGCPYCTHRIIVPGLNDLFTEFPRCESVWDTQTNTVDPHTIAAVTNLKVWWRCKKANHAPFQKTPREFLMSRNKCPYCSGERVLRGYNDLATLYPEIAKEFDVERNECGPEDVQAINLNRGIRIQFFWRCNAGHTYKRTVPEQVKNHKPCPVCEEERKQRLMEQGIGSLGVLYPDIAKLFDSRRMHMNPMKISVEEHMYTQMYWRCPRNHSWSDTIASLIHSGGQCPACKEAELRQKQADELQRRQLNREIELSSQTRGKTLSEARPDLAARLHPERNHGISGDMVMADSEQVLWWQCEKGHNFRRSAKEMCAYPHCPRCRFPAVSRKLRNAYIVTGDRNPNTNGYHEQSCYGPSDPGLWF